MKISILLPYKENFSPMYPGAVSLFLKDTIPLSKFKKDILVYGNTNYKTRLLKNYKNLEFKKYFFKSSSNSYLNKFIKDEAIIKSKIIEIHNRPNYVNTIYKKNKNIVLYFHNDPLKMKNSTSINDRIDLLNKTLMVIFNSKWTLNQFVKGIKKNFYRNKLNVIHQSTNKKKINFQNKKKIIIFVGRLNKSKGYDIFGNAVIKILNKYPDWKAIAIGDEPREKIIFNHKRFENLGFQNNSKVTSWFKKSDISVVCSRINEPFGRTALEASSAGCAVIITNRGGLPEASPSALKIKNLSIKNLQKKIEKLINNENYKKDIQKKIYKNFKLTNILASKKIDKYRIKFIKS
tara:strand:+ start:1931 stop:2974 length:1044 start_codon:yes stop_codon:yes gene_type:complete